MQILMIPCTYTCRNMGDVAMLQVAVDRLNASWPTARIHIPTKNKDSLLAYCPKVSFLPQGEWFSDHYLLGRIHNFLPKTVSRRLIRLKKSLRHWPALEGLAIRLKMKLTRADSADFNAYWRTLKEADLVVISGAGGVADVFPAFSTMVLEMLAMAIWRGVPTAMFSHGFGPLRNPELLDRAKAVLPKVDLIAIREKGNGLRLLKSLGVGENRIMVTGDDALEMSYEARVPTTGSAIGLNIRTMQPSELNDEIIERIRPVLHEFAREHNALLIPLPIALQQATDARAIQKVLNGYDNQSDGGQSLDWPFKVIEQIRECRIVVTGAYHAAVFALGQGIPAICLAKSEYFANKFFGLADLFPQGCQVILLDDEDVEYRMRTALKWAWKSAEQVRPQLLDNARAQIQMSKKAYARFKELVNHKEIVPNLN